nr:hypothetical protein [Mesorhizobium loti]
MEKITTIGLDIAKQVLQVHVINGAGGSARGTALQIAVRRPVKIRRGK